MTRQSKNPKTVMVQEAQSENSKTIRISSAEGFRDFKEITITIGDMIFTAIDIEAFKMLLAAYAEGRPIIDICSGAASSCESRIEL